MIPTVSRLNRVFVLGVAAAALCAPAAATKTRRIDLATPEGAVLAQRKIQCSLVDGEPTLYWFHGEAFSRVPGEPDRKLFNVEGMNVRACASKEDGRRGKGWRLVSRELLLYVDPQSGELLREWRNPWTGKSVKVLQTANDPVNQRWVFPRDASGNPEPRARFDGTIVGNFWWQTITVPLFYTNPLGGDYQKYVGGMYHATEMFNFFGNLDELTDPRRADMPVAVGWVRIASWLPWMEMGDRVGLIYIHAAGRKLASFEDLPPILKNAIATEYPEYRAPPPLDDTRPNETSWTYFKKKMPAPVRAD
ncbi:MAG: DUF1838 domain-containing protein [Steroidobacteraceae bacterium]|nr:DUF1838 domain-containing protein [Steroidobacteraceae bacterium]MDW8260404.1 DUF1838 family protein [Gammaproteobacteria bacterium]